MNRLQPLPHAFIDYAMAAKLMAAPWLFGYSDNQTATMCSISSGIAVAGLSLMTDYPLGAIKMIPFPVHGVIEASAAVMTAASPFLAGFSDNKRATWTHLIAGIATLAVVAITDYNAKANQALKTVSQGKIRDWRTVEQPQAELKSVA